MGERELYAVRLKERVSSPPRRTPDPNGRRGPGCSIPGWPVPRKHAVVWPLAAARPSSSALTATAI
jgi:hypothetical protein